MKKLLVFAASIVLLLGFLAPVAFSQGGLKQIDAFMAGRSVADSQTAENGEAAIIVRYIGTAANAQIAVSAAGTGDISFTEDVGSGLAADASVICPTGGTGGTIDVSDGDCDTLGEVVDIINAEAGANWVAVVHAGLRSLSSDTDLFALTATSNVMRPEGQDLNRDTTEADDVWFVLSENQDGRDYFTINGGLIPNPYRGKRASLFHLLYNLNLSDGAQTFVFYSVRPNNLVGGSAEVVTTLFAVVLADATATDVTLFQQIGISGNYDEKLVVGVQDSGATAGVTYVYAFGYEYDAPN